MKKYSYTLLFCFCLFGKVEGQVNLVQNGSFEDTSCCTIMPLTGDGYCKYWTDPNGSTSDYFTSYPFSGFTFNVPNNLYGWQTAHTGNAYAGIAVYVSPSTIPNYREYIQEQLSIPLVMNKTYCVEFYVNLSNNSNVSINNIGLYFSNTPPIPPTVHNVYNNCIPQVHSNLAVQLIDSAGWTKIEGSYIAMGAEDYITIGNFYNDINTDTSLIFEPGQNTSYYYIDDVSIIDCTNQIVTELNNANNITISPNPFNWQTTITFTEKQTNTNIKITDLLGKEINSMNFTGRQLVIDRAEMKAGIYFVQTIDDKQNIINRKIIIQ